MTNLLKRKISLTGYRLFFILQLLIQGPVSKDEILAQINKSGLIGTVGEDTIRLDINTLKSAGFEINTGRKIDGYKYQLDWNPLKIDFNRSEIKVFNQTKKAIIELCDWEFIANLHDVFLKISKFVQDEKIVDDFLNFGYFSNIDFEILKQLNAACKNHHLVKILYLSPNSGEKTIDVFCEKIIYKKDSKKLHLWGKSPQYKDFVYLRVDNILKILRVDLTRNINKTKLKTCKYRLKHTIGDRFKLDEREKITANTPEYLEVESIIYSEFYFIQRILSFGAQCFWVEDGRIRLKILDKLKKMRTLYENPDILNIEPPLPSAEPAIQNAVQTILNAAGTREQNAPAGAKSAPTQVGDANTTIATWGKAGNALSAPAPAAQEQI